MNPVTFSCCDCSLYATRYSSLGEEIKAAAISGFKYPTEDEKAQYINPRKPKQFLGKR